MAGTAARRPAAISFLTLSGRRGGCRRRSRRAHGGRFAGSWLATRWRGLQPWSSSCLLLLGMGTVYGCHGASNAAREDLVERGDIAVAVAKLLSSGEHGVCHVRRRDRDAQRLCCLQYEADVLVHQPDREPGLLRGVQQERDARLEHR